MRNALLDHEIAYLLMRDANPEYVRALMQEDVMLILKNVVDGEEPPRPRGRYS